MPAGFKDLSELHIASVESAQPEMFHKVIEVALLGQERYIGYVRGRKAADLFAARFHELLTQ
jgi:hypothetical protein